MSFNRRWRSIPYGVACLCVFAPSCLISWLLGREEPEAIRQLSYAWGLAWAHVLMAIIVNRHVFSANSLVFMAWAFLGNGLRLFFFIVAAALAWIILPGESNLFVATAIFAYFLFLFIEIFCLYLFSLRADRLPDESMPLDPAQAE